MSNATSTGSAQPAIHERFAAGPISWGVCECRAGDSAPPDRVSRRCAPSESSRPRPADGYLGHDPLARTLLDRNGLGFVGRLPSRRPPRAVPARTRRSRRCDGQRHSSPASGPRFINSAAVVDEGWSARIELTDAQWGHLLAALLPSTKRPRSTASSMCCTRTGARWSSGTRTSSACSKARRQHLPRHGASWRWAARTRIAIAREFAHRVVHVHLKDVDGGVADRLRSGELDLTAVQAGTIPTARRG